MEAALALRARDEEARITLVSAEHDHFFSRPALMYVFAGQTSLRDTEPYDRGLYERMRFERVSGRVSSLDAAGRALVFEDGSRLAYDRLLLAVGSQARPAPWPGAQGPGLHYFVTLRDLEALDREAKQGMKAAVVGGGLIGVEVAEVLHDRGLHVSFVIREGWYFPVALDDNEASARRRARAGARRRRAAGRDRRRASCAGTTAGSGAVRLAGGDEVPRPTSWCSTIGVVPNTGFLAGSGLALAANGAIETDDALRTLGAGRVGGGRLRERHLVRRRRAGRSSCGTPRATRDAWPRARCSATTSPTAAAPGTTPRSSSTSSTRRPGYVPAGARPGRRRRSPLPADLRTWFQRVPGRFESQRIVVKGDRVVGFNMLGSRWNHEPLLDWIHERRPLEWVLEHLAEAQFDEELSPRFRVLRAARAVS